MAAKVHCNMCIQVITTYPVHFDGCSSVLHVSAAAATLLEVKVLQLLLLVHTLPCQPVKSPAVAECIGPVRVCHKPGVVPAPAAAAAAVQQEGGRRLDNAVT